ncbi:MAG: sulfotransferase family 2 domain-containing protein [Pseudomonadota bacterium]
MPVFHDYNLIFIHIPKNAGRSIEEAFLGEGWQHSGKRSWLNAGAKWLLRWTSSHRPHRELLGSLDYTFAAQHMTLRELTELGLVTARTCPGFRSFAIVRNPYDRAVSSVFHHFGPELRLGRREIRDKAGFTSALRSWLDHDPSDHNQIAHRRPQFDFLTLRGDEVDVDEVIRYERLSDDLAAFCKRNELPPIKLGWAGKNKRRRDYREYFSDESRAYFEEWFIDDIERLGYKY